MPRVWVSRAKSNCHCWDWRKICWWEKHLGHDHCIAGWQHWKNGILWWVKNLSRIQSGHGSNAEERMWSVSSRLQRRTCDVTCQHNMIIWYDIHIHIIHTHAAATETAQHVSNLAIVDCDWKWQWCVCFTCLLHHYNQLPTASPKGCEWCENQTPFLVWNRLI